MKVFLITIFSAIALIILPFMPQIPSLLDTHMPKRGRVIDTETGKGLPNAFVLSSAEFSSDPIFFGPSGHLFLYSVLTRTDSDGRYIIPSTWSDIHIGTPGTNPHFSWVITVFEPGYAVVGDEKAWEFDETYGMTRYKARSAAISPDLSGIEGMYIRVSDIKMYRPSLSLKEAAAYYSSIRSVLRRYYASTDQKDVAIRRKGYDFFASRICNLDPLQEIDQPIVFAAISYSRDPDASMKLFKILEPESSEKEIYDRPKFKAGNACKIITNGSDSP